MDYPADTALDPRPTAPSSATQTSTNTENHAPHGDLSPVPDRYYPDGPTPWLQPEDPRESSDFVSPGAPTRMLIRYTGSKWRLAPRIIALIQHIAPKATTYTEAYAGALARLDKAGYLRESRTLTSTLRGDATVIRRTEHIYYRPAK